MLKKELELIAWEITFVSEPASSISKKWSIYNVVGSLLIRETSIFIYMFIHEHTGQHTRKMSIEININYATPHSYLFLIYYTTILLTSEDSRL